MFPTTQNDPRERVKENPKRSRFKKKPKSTPRLPVGSPPKKRKKGFIVIEVFKHAVPEDASQPQAALRVLAMVDNTVHAHIPTIEIVPASASPHVTGEIVMEGHCRQLCTHFFRGEDRRRSVAGGRGIRGAFGGLGILRERASVGGG
ncbi:hypothetical protein M5K25_023332 [Dendrobium thyrsiflorum]|uniref:Uncharacterized protein n=1 Tax=Dendrobium thyrsiflorum TaxID=117978 RepID=A0ABD0U7U4_DENTH